MTWKRHITKLAGLTAIVAALYGCGGVSRQDVDVTYDAGPDAEVMFDADYDSDVAETGYDGSVDAQIDAPEDAYIRDADVEEADSADTDLPEADIDPCDDESRSDLETDIVSTSVSPMEGDSVTLTCDNSGGVMPYTTTIEPGDGTIEYSESKIHTFSFEGIYTSTCTVTDACDDSASSSIDIFVRNNPPDAYVDITRTAGSPPFSRDYRCHSDDNGNPPFTVEIDFDGDGTIDTRSASGTVTYPSAGLYEFTCILTDADGDTDIYSFTLAVED